MMVMKVKYEDWALSPTRGHATDAGLDLYSPIDFEIPPHGSVIVSTGVHIQLPKITCGLVKSRSSLMKKGIQADGLIDEGYTGEIGVCLFSHSNETVKISAGDRIAQIVIIECFKPVLAVVETLDSSERGNGGFGSTGK